MHIVAKSTVFLLPAVNRSAPTYSWQQCLLPPRASWCTEKSNAHLTLKKSVQQCHDTAKEGTNRKTPLSTKLSQPPHSNGTRWTIPYCAAVLGIATCLGPVAPLPELCQMLPLPASHPGHHVLLERRQALTRTHHHLKLFQGCVLDVSSESSLSNTELQS